MIVDPDFLDHWRTRLLVNLLGGDELAPLYVIRIWGHCQNRRAVHFDGMSAEGLKALCRYSGEADKLESALIESRFIARSGGAIEVCKWADHNASLLASWENGRTGGRPRKPPENPEETHGKPTGNPGETDKRRAEESRGEQRRFKGNGKSNGSTPDAADDQLPLDARGNGGKGKHLKLIFTDEQWDRAIAMAEAVARKIPPDSTDGRRCWFKYAMLAETEFSEDWLMDAVAGALAKPSRKNKQSHLVSILQSKARAQGIDDATFQSLMDRTEVPPHIWKSSNLEVVNAR